MYPRILEIPLPFEIFGAESLTIYSFGAMMAVAFLVAAWLSRRELDRLHQAGYLGSGSSTDQEEQGQGAAKGCSTRQPGKPGWHRRGDRSGRRACRRQVVSYPREYERLPSGSRRHDLFQGGADILRWPSGCRGRHCVVRPQERGKAGYVL